MMMSLVVYHQVFKMTNPCNQSAVHVLTLYSHLLIKTSTTVTVIIIEMIDDYRFINYGTGTKRGHGDSHFLYGKNLNQLTNFFCCIKPTICPALTDVLLVIVEHRPDREMIHCGWDAGIHPGENPEWRSENVHQAQLKKTPTTSTYKWKGLHDVTQQESRKKVIANDFVIRELVHHFIFVK